MWGGSLVVPGLLIALGNYFTADLSRAGPERRNQNAENEEKGKTRASKMACLMNIRDVKFWHSGFGART